MKKLIPIAAIFLGVGAVLASFTPEVEAHPRSHTNLLLYEESPTITSCPTCDHSRSGTGPLYDCDSCESGCNCLVESWTDATGQDWDGRYYPGVQ